LNDCKIGDLGTAKIFGSWLKVSKKGALEFARGDLCLEGNMLGETFF
jgi:hypothetical protein